MTQTSFTAIMARTCSHLLKAANACLYGELTLQLVHNKPSSPKLARLATTLESRRDLALQVKLCFLHVNSMKSGVSDAQLESFFSILACIWPLHFRVMIDRKPNMTLLNVLDTSRVHCLEMTASDRTRPQTCRSVGNFTQALVLKCNHTHALRHLSLVISECPEIMLKEMMEVKLPNLRYLQVLGLSFIKGSFELLGHLLAHATQLDTFYLNCISRRPGGAWPYEGVDGAIVKVNDYLRRLQRLSVELLDVEAYMLASLGPPGYLHPSLLKGVKVQTLHAGLPQLVCQMEIMQTVEHLTLRLLPDALSAEFGKGQVADLQLFAEWMAKVQPLPLRTLFLEAPNAMYQVPGNLSKLCRERDIQLEW